MPDRIGRRKAFVVAAAIVYGVAMFAVPYSITPALAPAILAVGHRSYTVLFAVAGVCALLAAVTILPVGRAR